MSNSRRDRPTTDDQGDSAQPGSPEGGRSAAEWVSLSISLAIVLALVGFIVYLYTSGGGSDSVIRARPELDQVRQEGGDYYLPLVIENTGGATAEDVIVEATLVHDDGVQETAEVTVRFLAGDAREDATVVFSEAPRDGELSVDVRSYLQP